MADKELDHNGIIRLNAEGDKVTSLSIGVYQGNASLVVFSNKLMLVKFPFPQTFITKLRMSLSNIISSAPGTKVSFSFSKFDGDTKKWNGIGNLVVGKDDKSIIYFGIQAPSHPAMKFPIKSPLSFDTSDPMSDVDRSALGAYAIVDQLTISIPTAIAITSFKRDASMNAKGGGYSGADTFSF